MSQSSVNQKSGLMSVSFSSAYIYFVFVLPAFIVYMLYSTIILNNYNAIYMQLLFFTFSTEGMKREHKHKQGFYSLSIGHFTGVMKF